MSIFTDMVPATVLINNPAEGVSGAPKDNYVKLKDTMIAVYKNDSFRSVQSTKYEKSTHNGLTLCKDFADGKEYRIQIGSTVMDVTYFNTEGRFTALLMKEITYG